MVRGRWPAQGRGGPCEGLSCGAAHTRRERRWNEGLCARLERHCEVFLPQRDGGYLGDLMAVVCLGWTASRSVFDRDVEAFAGVDLVVARLSMSRLDPGVLVEIGDCLSLWGNRCIALAESARRIVNSMIANAVQRLVQRAGRSHFMGSQP